MKYLLMICLMTGFAGVAHAAPASAALSTYTLPTGDSITLEYLVAMDKKKFKNKPVAEFLSSKEAAGWLELAFRHNEEGLLQGLKIKYSDSLYLNVYVEDFKHLPPFNPDKSWDMEALKKESIAEIRVVYVMHE